MKVTSLALREVCLIEHAVYTDERGHFFESWNDATFRREVADVGFVQDNASRSRRGTIRGLHFQSEFTQGKLVRCVSGRIHDVAVDIRRSSGAFGQWIAVELSSENRCSLWVPPGFAHGFLVLSDSADVEYKVTDRYHSASEQTLLWNDEALGISWPLQEGVALSISPKDAAGAPLAQLQTLP